MNSKYYKKINLLNNEGNTQIMTIKKNEREKKLLMYGAIGAAALLIFSLNSQIVLAHQRQLFNIGGKDYLLVVGSQNEPVFVDDKSGVDFFAYTPDPKDPMNSVANGTKHIEGLEKTSQSRSYCRQIKRRSLIYPLHLEIQVIITLPSILQFRQHINTDYLEP